MRIFLIWNFALIQLTGHPMTLKIQHWPTDQLIPYARNARTHSDEQVAQIAGSIAEFGFVNPVLYFPQPENFSIHNFRI